MFPSKTHSGNDHQTPKPISRSSSLTTISPIVRDGLDEIASKLVEIESIIESLNTELSPDTARPPSVEELLQEIATLHEEVKGTKASQDAHIRAIRDDVKNNTQNQIVHSMQDQIQSIIADTIAAQVKTEMKDWGDKPRVVKFVDSLESVVEENDALLRESLIQLENSRSRHANSTLDVHDDFNVKLKPIKRRDGSISELFPANLRELFSCDADRVFQLIKEHNLRPLEKHSENLSRFLSFIGLRASIPDQQVDSLVEQPPAYPLGNVAVNRGEMNEKGARRSSSASQDAKQRSWSWY